MDAGARAALAAALAALTGCGDPCPLPEFGGKASDEAWMTMVDAEKRVVVDDAKAATVLEPVEGAAYKVGAAAPTVRWSSPLTASNAPLGPKPKRPWSWTSLLISEAHAHLPPVTGPAHALRIDVPGQKCAVRAFTTETAYTFTEAQWTALQSAAGKSLALEITSAYLRENRIAEGPFRASAARAVRVE